MCVCVCECVRACVSLYARMPAVCYRCYYRGYKYAALSQGSRCTCGNVAMMTGGFVADPLQDCSEECAGNTNQNCGGKKAFDIWETGK